MITPVILPQLGDTMDEATLTRWYKREGDAVKKGEPLFEILTDKANIDVEATSAGFLRAALCGENETRAVGEIVAYLTTTADEPFRLESAQAESAQPAGKPTLEVSQTKEQAAGHAPDARTAVQSKRGKPFVSPRARREWILEWSPRRAEAGALSKQTWSNICKLA
jgi:pyruvate/2-oxoglutarate dehydrogenase complex dihydrolipoamide acyltransferase (E2) component